ncbi:MAG: hypothetical protein ACXVCK_15045, partial [Bdellovibrionota bacterium]
MLSRPNSWALILAVSVCLVLLGTFDAFRFLWVFPLDSAGLPLWMVLCGLDIFLARQFPRQGHLRLLLWSAGLLFFSARQHAPLAAVALILLSAALWVAHRSKLRYLPVALGVGFLLLAFGHDDSLLTPAMAPRLGDLHFAVHLVSAFALFRMISWLVAVKKRGANPGFLLTMEYLLAPAFWLSPLHAAHLQFDRMQPPAEPIPSERSLGWILRGFLHAFLFSLIVTIAVPQLESLFRGGVSAFAWWHWVLVGPFLFVVSYLEKSRVTYVVAGSLSLCGHDVMPDFRSPWAARGLLDYWRRFHFWIWEYYIDLIYMPLSILIGRRLNPRAAGLLALFVTFTLGTSLIHWVHYPAPLAMALLLGLLFGSASVAHALASKWMRNPLIGIPCTWVTVFGLYFLAYPAYGLGWGLP